MMDSELLRQRVESVAEAIGRNLGTSYDVMVVLGSGLFNFVEKLRNSRELRYADIPQLPVSTVRGHAGKVVGGEIAGRRVLCFAGRFHYYEGYDAASITIPVRAARVLGARTAFLTNAAGGLSSTLRIGDLMVIRDHLNLMAAESPLRGLADDLFGSKFVDMYGAYDPELAALLESIGKARALPVASGVYAAMAGPQYETRAEIRMLQRLGADAVGMSTVPEVIVANQLGIRVGAVSVITDLATDAAADLSHEQVVAAAQRADGHLAELLEAAVGEVAR